MRVFATVLSEQVVQVSATRTRPSCTWPNRVAEIKLGSGKMQEGRALGSARSPCMRDTHCIRRNIM